MQNIGGNIFLGQLYDGTKEQKLTGDFLWHPDKMVIRKGPDSEKVKDDIFQEHSVLDRLNIFNFDVALKVSFMGGLVQVEG